jgi:hypothetical protein
MIGLADRDSTSNFFIYLSVLISFSILMNTQMALFASVGSAAQVQVFSSVALLAMMLFGGFIIPPNAIPKYYQWLYWWNPLAWAYRALLVNEFYDARWGNNSTQILEDYGLTFLNGEAFGIEWVGYSFAYMIPYLLTCSILSAFGLTFVRHSEGGAGPSREKNTSASLMDEPKQGTYIPFKPVTLSFHDICYEVTASTSKLQLSLLNKVNGVFRPGQMCALMVRDIIVFIVASRCCSFSCSFVDGNI